MTEIPIFRGDDVRWALTLKNTTGVVDVTGWTFAGMVRLLPDSAVAATWSFDTADAATGVVIASLARADTSLLAPGLYGFAFAYTDSGNKKSTFLAGRLIVKADYTHV